MSTNSERFIRKKSVTCRELDGEAVVFDPETESLHVLNPTAYFIWNLCDRKLPAQEIARYVAEEYSIGPDEALGDVKELFAQLEKVGLGRTTNG